MKDEFGVRDKRYVDRVKMNWPAIYVRFDERGNPCDQRICKVKDLSLKGVRLQSTSPIDSGEVLDVTLGLGDKMVSFKGKVVHTRLSEEHYFEFGVSIDAIEDKQRKILIWFLSRIANLEVE